MKTVTFYNKAAWPDGVWLDEPDYQAWIDENNMYACTIRRNIYGALAGFVGVGCSHPLYQVQLFERTFDFIDVYGDVTFTGFSKEDDVEFFPPDRRWWIGFSCMTVDDLFPLMKSNNKSKSASYKDLEFVRSYVESLSAQLATMDHNLLYADELF